MFKPLGTFALLAVCLFTIAIVMGGCATAKLLPSYPPSRPGTETWIPYELSEAAAVIITLHDSDRKLVRTLFLGQKPAGTYKSRERAAHWDGRNAQGEPVASGTYHCTLIAGEFSTTRRLFIGTGLRPSYSRGTEVWIPYHLSEPTMVTLTISDENGNLVRMLVHSQKPAGIYRQVWDGRNAQGKPLGWGTYFCTLTAGEFFATQKVLEKGVSEDIKAVSSVIREEIEKMKKEKLEEIERRKKEKIEEIKRRARQRQ